MTHLWLKAMQAKFHNIQHIFTQNIDELESCIDCPITNLHGSLHQGHCLRCGYSLFISFTYRKSIDSSLLQQAYRSGSVLHCPCGGVVKPDIVFYNECVDSTSMERMKQASVVCDLLLILGTSLSTHPVSECVRLFDHCDLLVLNQSNIQIPERGDGVKTVQILGSFRELFGEDGDALTEPEPLKDKCVYVLSVAIPKRCNP